MDEDNQFEQNEDFDIESEGLLPGVDDLPLFANAEARQLDLEIKEKDKKLESVVTSIFDMKERVKIMKEHFHNVQQEVDHTNALVSSKRMETQTESHLQQLTSRLLGRSKAESNILISETEKQQERLNQLQNQIFSANEKMDEFKMQMNWNQEELDQWAVAAHQKEEDNLALQKYTRADEIKIKELNLNVEQLSKDLILKRQALENEVTDTQAKQMELDRIADEFRQMHSERQVLVAQWQETIESMKARDQKINQVGEKYSVARAERAKMEVKVLGQQKRLQAQIKENEEVEAKSELLTRTVSRKREDMVNGAAKLVDYRNELESLKNELMSAAEGLVASRAQNANKAREIEEKRVQVERERQKYKESKQRMEDSKQATAQAEQTVKEAEDELEAAEKQLLSQQTRLKFLKDNLLKETQHVNELKRLEATLRSEISGTKSATRNMDGQLVQLDKDAARQQELLYNAEFQIQQIERKVARGMGERSDEEKKILKAMITQSEERLADIKEKRKVMLAQARKLLNELVAARMRKEDLVLRKSSLSEKMNELELENRMVDEEVRRDTRVKEEMVVQNDVLRLEVRRLRGLLSLKADAVYSLENRKQQLALSMEERKEEIAVHRDVLRAELRTIQDEKHNATMDLRSREIFVDRLKARYEASSMMQGQDEGQSQSYYIIKAAQKREELRRQGDELDTEISKCEREIRALQTTLDHLNARNVAFRASFQKVDISGDEGEVLRQLEERSKLAKESLFRKKKELQRLVSDFEEDERRLEQVRMQSNRVSQQKDHLESTREQVQEEILSQEAQLHELQQRSAKMTESHQIKMSKVINLTLAELAQRGGTVEEKQVQAEILKDVVQNVLFTLGQLAKEFPEVSDRLHLKLEEADLKIPAKPTARNPPASSMSASRGASRGGDGEYGGQ